MRLGKVVAYVAYAALAVAFASGGLACASTTGTTGGVGPPAATGAEAPPPASVRKLATLTSVAPRTGADGSLVTIMGTGFTGAELVCFGSASSRHYQVSNAGTRILAVVPPGSGTVPVVVVTPAGASPVEPYDTFRYRSSPVAVSATSSAPASPCASLTAEILP